MKIQAEKMTNTKYSKKEDFENRKYSIISKFSTSIMLSSVTISSLSFAVSSNYSNMNDMIVGGLQSQDSLSYKIQNILGVIQFLGIIVTVIFLPMGLIRLLKKSKDTDTDEMISKRKKSAIIQIIIGCIGITLILAKVIFDIFLNS